MPLANESALREEFRTLHSQLSEQLTTSAAANAGTPKFSAEEKTHRDQKYARMDAIKAAVDEDTRLAGMAFGGAANSALPAIKSVVLPAQPNGQNFAAAAAGDGDTGAVSDYLDAVNQFARTGERAEILQSVKRFEKSASKALRQLYTITTATGSSAYLPKSVLPPTDVKRLPNAWRRLLARMGQKPITRTLTESISLPVEDDTGNTGQQQAQNATNGTLLDSDASGSVTLNPVLYSSKQIWLSNTVVGALDFDVIQWVLPRLAKRLDKSEESAWTASLVAAATSGLTAASATGAALTYAELLTWEHSLNAAYRDDAGFVLSDGLYKLIRGMVDSNNRPIMDLDPTNEFQSSIHGKPVVIGDYVAPPAHSAISGVFASAEAILMMDAGMQRLARYVLVPGYPDQTGFELFANADMGFVVKGVRTMTFS